MKILKNFLLGVLAVGVFVVFPLWIISESSQEKKEARGQFKLKYDPTKVKESYILNDNFKSMGMSLEDYLAMRFPGWSLDTMSDDGFRTLVRLKKIEK